MTVHIAFLGDIEHGIKRKHSCPRRDWRPRSALLNTSLCQRTKLHRFSRGQRARQQLYYSLGWITSPVTTSSNVFSLDNRQIYNSVVWLVGPKAHFTSNFLGLHNPPACGQDPRSRGFCNGCIAVETICYATSEIRERNARRSCLFSATMRWKETSLCLQYMQQFYLDTVRNMTENCNTVRWTFLSVPAFHYKTYCVCFPFL